MSGDNNEHKDPNHFPSIAEPAPGAGEESASAGECAPAPESSYDGAPAGYCVWLEHCEADLFGSPAVAAEAAARTGAENAPQPEFLAEYVGYSRWPSVEEKPASEAETATLGKPEATDAPRAIEPSHAGGTAEAVVSADDAAPEEPASGWESPEPRLSPSDEADIAAPGDGDGGEAFAAGAAAGPRAVEKIKDKPPLFPPLAAPPQAPPTLFSRLFDLLALIGPAALTLLLLAQVFFPLQSPRPLWAPGETAFADILRGVLSGDWLILTANGQVYFDSPPLYFWFLAGLHELLDLPVLNLLLGGAFERADKIAAAIFAGSAVSGLLLLWATLFMARCAANFDRRGGLAAGAVLLGLFLFAGVLHYGSQDLFFCALVATSQVFLFRGLRRSSSMLNIGLGFAFASLAFLAKGLPGLLLPLLCAVIFAFWQGRPWRLLHKDFLLGLIFSLLPAVLWVGVIWADGHYEVVARIIKEQFIGAVLQGWDYSGPWWYYLLALPLLLLPWVFLAIFPNWAGLFSRETVQAAKGAFRGERQGLAFVWLSLFCALFSFFLLSLKSPLDILPLFAPLSVVAGRMALGLSPLRNMLLQRILAVFFLALALAFAILPVHLSGRAESVLGWLGGFGLPVLGLEIGGVFIIALAFLAAGCLLLGPVNARRPESTLLIVLFLVVGISYPLSTMSAPSLGKLLSPAENASILSEYVEQGYEARAFAVDGASFAYYAKSRLEPATEEDLTAWRPEDGRRIVLLAGASAWEALPAKPELAVVDRFRLAADDYVILLKEPPAEPAEAPESGGLWPAVPEESALSAE